MKRLLCAVLLMCAYASAQQINPAQIQPGTNGQQLCTVGGVSGWANCGGSAGAVLLAPTAPQTITLNTNGANALTLSNPNAGSSAVIGYELDNGTNQAAFSLGGTGNSSHQGALLSVNTPGGDFVIQSNNGPLLLQGSSTTIPGGVNTSPTDTGTANAYVAAVPACSSSPTFGTTATFPAANASTGASTFSWGCGETPATLFKNGSTNLTTGDILVGATYTVWFDGTHWQLLNSSLTGGGGGTPAGSNGNPQINASGSFGAAGQVFYQQSGDTIASIETQCSSLCTYVVTEPQTITLASSHSLSANVNLYFMADGSWTVNGSGDTLSNVQIAPGTTRTNHFPAGSGSVTLSALNNLNPVLWFGAKCDGSTNDLAAIQASINATTYGQVVLPAGQVCNIAGTLTYTKSNTGMTCSADLQGGTPANATPACALVETTSGDDAIDVHGTSGSYVDYGNFSNFNIRSSVTQTGTAAGFSASFTGGLRVTGVLSQDFFYPFYIHASPSYGTSGGFYGDAAYWTSLSSGLSTPIGFYLDSADGHAEDSLTIRDSTVAQGGGPNSCIGMMLNGTAVNDVNTFNFNIAGCNDGQDVNYTGTGATASASDNHFISTTVDSYHQHGMYFTATSTADAQSAGSSITVVDPRISTVGATDGINITNTSGVIVSAGQFLNVGIIASGATQLTFTGSTIQNAPNPISLNNSTYAAISSNTITNASGAAGAYGILLTGTSSNNNVTSNNVTGYFNDWDIFTDTGTANNTIVGNRNDPTNATLGGTATNGTGNVVYDTPTNTNFAGAIIDTTGLNTTVAAFRGMGGQNFSGWKDASSTHQWGLGWAIPGGTTGNNPIFSIYNGSYLEAWDINSANGVLDSPNGFNTFITTAANSGANANSPNMSFIGNRWNGSASVTNPWSCYVNLSNWSGNPDTAPSYLECDYGGSASSSAFKVTNLFAPSIQSAGVNIFALSPTIALTVATSGISVSGTNYSSPFIQQAGNVWSGSGNLADAWNWQDVVGTGTMPSVAYTLTHAGSTGAASVNFGSLPVTVGSLTATGGTPGVATPVLSINGTTFTASGCSNSTLVGGATAGSFDSGTTGTCTVTVTMGASVTAAHGFYCGANDITTPADVIHETAFTTTTATLSGTTVSGDLLNFNCVAY